MYTFLELNNDYGPGPYTITFPPGRVNSSFNITITDDIALEGNEIFNLTLHVTNTLIPSNVSIGNLSQATVTILDNDRMLHYLHTTYLKVNVVVISSSYHCSL